MSMQAKNEELICFGGVNDFHQLISSTDSTENEDIINPPRFQRFNSSELLSYSVYSSHSILVNSEGCVYISGSNSNKQILNSDQKSYSIFTKYERNSQIKCSVCCSYYSLYIPMQISMKIPHNMSLHLSVKNNGDPFFIKGNVVSVFCGDQTLAIVNSSKTIIFISKEMIKQVPPLVESIKPLNVSVGKIEVMQIACLEKEFFVLSSDNHLYEFNLNENNSNKLIQIKSIENVKFVFLSGTSNHCLAVSKSGDVYAYGNNECGQLGIGKSGGAVGEFVKINKFTNSKIVASFAGFNHSLFIDQKGAVYACGNNEFGELLLEKNDSKCVISPLQTVVLNGASFCIAGKNLSAVFITKKLPPNMIKHTESKNGKSKGIY